jgi:uncharacterized DUF497 family protein
MQFQWTVGAHRNIAHVARDGLVPAQVEQAVLDPYRLGYPGRQVRGEERGALVGMAGPLVLFVVYTIRAGAGRVVTAVRARPRHVREYLAARAAKQQQEEQADD